MKNQHWLIEPRPIPFNDIVGDWNRYAEMGAPRTAGIMSKGIQSPPLPSEIIFAARSRLG
ncbi:hypothetical protein LB506_003245 [Fusarium annulatum]|nr:hypothetical protein LB506_003245 [Fusarium annulatum]